LAETSRCRRTPGGPSHACSGSSPQVASRRPGRHRDERAAGHQKGKQRTRRQEEEMVGVVGRLAARDERSNRGQGSRLRPGRRRPRPTLGALTAGPLSSVRSLGSRGVGRRARGGRRLRRELRLSRRRRRRRGRDERRGCRRLLGRRRDGRSSGRRVRCDGGRGGSGIGLWLRRRRLRRGRRHPCEPDDAHANDRDSHLKEYGRVRRPRSVNGAKPSLSTQEAHSPCTG
jgi:hypothetical protein